MQAFEILKLLNGTNSGGLVISSRCWPTTYHATGQKMEVPILNACKNVKVIS